MGLFDIFTGDAAEEAAAENTKRLNKLKTEGLGYLDSGKSGALGALDTAAGSFAPVSALGTKYNAAGDMYLNSLGLNGAAGNDAATAAFRSSPGYDFNVNQSLDALDRRAASRGLLGSGNNSLDTLNVVHGLADQDYQNYLTRLAGLTSLGAQETNVGAAGTATAQAAKAPIFTNDANQRVALASGITNGVNQQATQAANAETAASGNIFGFGLNLAKLGTGLLGGAAAAPLSLGTIGGTGGGLGGLY